MKLPIPFLLLALLLSAVPAVAQAATRSEINERIVRKMYDDMLNAYKFEDAIGYVSQWVIQHSTPGGEVSGVGRFRDTYQQLKEAFPDYQFQVQEVLSDGNKVAIRYRFTGTHTGPLLSIAPSNKKISVWGIDYLRIEEGKIREVWGSPISAALLNAINGIKTGTEASAPAAPRPAKQTPPT